MSSRGGARDGAGRPRGSVDLRHSSGLAQALGEGVLPHEYMASVLRDENADPKARAWAAEKLAPYLCARPAPLQRTVELDLPDTNTVEGIMAALARITQAAAAGEIAPSEAQSLAALIEGQRKAIETGELLARIEALEAKQAR